MSHAADAQGPGDHGHGEHDHPPFLAHHFDDPEQQYDSGKLGMWLFLVTEILFFSGMFCAYALYRARNPDVWTFASQYLNETLGAVNTCVLLFSSLTMAWGVRCAQLRQRAGLVICLAITLGCAAMFLGVKAIEYTHKWDLGLLPAGLYEPQYMHAAAGSVHHAGISPWLYWLSAIPAACVVGFAIWFVMTMLAGKRRESEVSGSLLATALCYFLGVGLGMLLQGGDSGSHDEKHVAGVHAAEHTGADAHDEGDAEDGDAEDGDAEDGDAEDGDDHEGGADEHADHADEHAESDDGSHSDTGSEVAAAHTTSVEVKAPGTPPTSMVDQPGGAGLFFSIYYCMTGVHAIHILGGMGVLVWLLIRASKDHFNEQYFGPVDYVGLYWHLVDLIWIFLFPLLYLIK